MSAADLRYPRQTLWADYIRASAGALLCGLPLLAIDVNQPESEDLNAIFRAAHSIKGALPRLVLPTWQISRTYWKTCSTKSAKASCR